MVPHTNQDETRSERDPDDATGRSVRDPSRRSVLGGLAAATTGSLFSTTATAEPRETVPVPSVTGPIPGQPQTGAVHDLSEYGYVEEEYFVEGKARPLGPIDPYPVDERVNPSSKPASYRTRMLVYRPKRRREFNGTVVVEWPNVSTGRDAPVTWINTFDYAMREGYAVVIASAQKVGVDDSPEDRDLATGNPDRYGSLHHPGDEYAYDMFAQAVAALTERSDDHARGHAKSKGNAKSKGDADPMGGLDVERVVATGMSQSAQYLRYYVNELQADHDLIDGFLPFVTSRTPAEPDDIRDDLVPVMWVMSEDEADQVRREDSGYFRLWEVAGASHVNYWLVHWAGAMDARDFGDDEPPWDPAVAGQYGQRADGTYGTCGVNYFPMRYAYRAAMDQLQDWLVRGEAPPHAPRIERTVEDDGSVTVQRDEFGNARGGFRLPPIDVPVAHYDAMSCDLYGRTFRLEDETLADLYPSRKRYLGELATAVESAIDAGYLLPEDGIDLLRRALRADIGSR